jgi:lysophospholipase L1-like esterase
MTTDTYRGRPGPRRRLRTAAAVSGSLFAAAAVAAAAVLYRMGHDKPSWYAARVRAIPERFPDGLPQGNVLLTGSSYMEFWETSAKDLAPLDTVNIGIGGTKIGDHRAYIAEMIVPFAPRALVVYAGSNDINAIPFLSKSCARVAELVLDYVDAVQRRLPGLPIHYVAITEAPIRARVRAEIQHANRLLKAAAEKRDDFHFVDTAPALLGVDGHIDDTLFRKDRLHLDTNGYAIFASVVRTHLAAFFADLRAPGR